MMQLTSAAFAQLSHRTNRRLQLIDGQVFESARPVPNHQRLLHDVLALIDDLMPAGEVLFSINLHLAEGQDYEPDVIWIAAGSACQETPTGFEGAPELVVECYPAAPPISTKAANSTPMSVMV